MKKIMTLVAMTLLAIVNALAQWQPSDNLYTRLDKPGISGQTQMKTLRTTDGKIVLTWLRWSESLSWDNPQAGFFLHMQIFDTNGKALFGDEGILISEQPTATYTTGYGLALAPNGDVLIAYPDTRNDANKNESDVYVYRYSQAGQAVWSSDGLKIPTKVTHAEGSQYAPSLCVSGDNIYVSLRHSEVYQEKANENNWQPNPMFPDEPMPEYVDVGYTDYQVVRLNDDGTTAWTDNFQENADMILLLAAPEGDIYLIYNNETYGLEAQRLNKDGKNVWGTPVTVESEALTSGEYMPTPLAVIDDEGGVVLAYRKILALSGYEVFNHLTPDGKALPQALLANGSTEGDSGADALATRGPLAYVVWRLETVALSMHSNLFKLDGSYAWEGGKSEGVAIDALSEWDFRPLKIIPQVDGWVILYGNATDWNAAKFIACKIDDDGKTIWSKQLAEGDFRSSGFSIVNDNDNAYIFFTRDDEISETGEVISGSGGMFVMCVDITNAGNTNGIASFGLKDKGQITDGKCYDLNGRRLYGKPVKKSLYIRNGKKHI